MTPCQRQRDCRQHQGAIPLPGLRWLAGAAVLLALSGCDKKPAVQPTLPPEFYQPVKTVQEVPVAHIVRRDYRLREGDQLEIIYHVRHQKTNSYRIQLQDVIDIRFPFHAQLNQTSQVQSDGTLQLDLIGAIKVFDRTIEDVQDDLIRRYAKYIKNPVLTVSFKQSNVKIAELKEAIRTAPRGQSRLVPITPDGTISLPFIADMRAAGRTISEMHTVLNDAYQKIGLSELEVTVNVQQVAPLRVFVLGEVRQSGAVLNREGSASALTEISLLQAVAQAGSYISPRAELSKVMLVRRRHLPRPQVVIVNVHQLLENRARLAGQAVVADSSLYRYDIWLEDGDIIYVPTSEIARRADYIDYVWTRGIRAVLGTNTSVNYDMGDAVNFIKP